MIVSTFLWYWEENVYFSKLMKKVLFINDKAKDTVAVHIYFPCNLNFIKNNWEKIKWNGSPAHITYFIFIILLFEK